MKSRNNLDIELKEFIDNISTYLTLALKLLEIDSILFTKGEINRMHDICERFFLKNMTFGFTENQFELIFTAYAGEAFIHYHPGVWSISTLKRDPAYGKFIIIDWAPPGRVWVRACPYEWLVGIKNKTFGRKLSDVITWQFNL